MGLDTEPTTTKKYLQETARSIISQWKIPKRHSVKAVKASQSFHCELQESFRTINTVT